MKKWLLLLALFTPTIARANTITPQFTQGSMQSTTTTTQTIVEDIQHEVYGGDYSSWSGTNITPSAEVNGTSTTFSVTDTSQPFQLEITERTAGIIETIDIDRTITTNATTTSLSVFSQ